MCTSDWLAGNKIQKQIDLILKHCNLEKMSLGTSDWLAGNKIQKQFDLILKYRNLEQMSLSTSDCFPGKPKNCKKKMHLVSSDQILRARSKNSKKKRARLPPIENLSLNKKGHSSNFGWDFAKISKSRSNSTVLY